MNKTTSIWLQFDASTQTNAFMGSRVGNSEKGICIINCKKTLGSDFLLSVSLFANSRGLRRHWLLTACRRLKNVQIHPSLYSVYPFINLLFNKNLNTGIFLDYRIS